MANQLVEVINLLSSDEDSNPKVETTPNVGNYIIPHKVTARKSMCNRIISTISAVKEEPPPRVSKSSVADNKSKNMNNIQTELSDSAGTKENQVLPKKTARKSLSNSKCSIATKVVSTLTNSSNLQCAPTTSKSKTVSTAQSDSLANAVVAAAKLPGITITPLQSSATAAKSSKGLPTARKTCNSRTVPESIRIANKYFQPSSTSTPKVNTDVHKKTSSAILTNSIVPEKLKLLKPLIPPATSVLTCSKTSVSSSSFKVPSSINTLTKHLPPNVSIKPLTEKGSNLKVSASASARKSMQNSKANVEKSLVNSLGKSGVTITDSSKSAQNEKILVYQITTKSKDGKESQSANPVNDGMTITKSLNSAATKNNLKGGNNRDRQKKELIKENPVIDSIATKSGIVITPVTMDNNYNKQTTLQNKKSNDHSHKKKSIKGDSSSFSKSHPELTVQHSTKTYKRQKSSKCLVNKNSEISIKRMQLDNIVGSLKASKPVDKSKDSRDNARTFGSLLSKTKTVPKEVQPHDPLKTLKSNNAVTILPVSKNVPLPVVHSESSVKSAVQLGSEKSLKKRTLSKNHSDSASASKKPRTETEPRCNGDQANLSYKKMSEDNKKRITVLKESLKEIAAKTSQPKTKASSKQYSNKFSDSVNSVTEKDTKASLVEGKMEKLEPKPTDFTPSQSCLKEKSGNSTKASVNARPLKQVTSPKLSLKRKSADVVASPNHNMKVIPLPYPLPPDKKLKGNSTPQNRKVIPLPYPPSEMKLESIATDLNKEAIPMPAPNRKEMPLSVPNREAIPLPAPNIKEMPLSVSNKETIPLPAPFPSSPPARQNYVSKDSMPWNSADSNATRLEKLLEFSKPFMSASPEEKCKISKNFCKYLDKADPSYVNSNEFRILIDGALKNIESNPGDTFVHLSIIKTELEAYKRKKGPANARSSSGSQSEDIKSAPKPKLELPKEPPSLEADLASAIRNITSSLKHKESRTGSNGMHSLPTVPSTSKQSDIFENLRLSVDNSAAPPSDWVSVPCTSRQADIVENLRLSMPQSSILQSVGLQSVQESDPAPAKMVNGGLFYVAAQKAQVATDQPNPSKSKEEKIRKRVEFLEKHLALLDQKIKKLQAKEMSLEDMDDDESTYITEDRYKKKFHKTWVTLCKLKKRSPLVGREIDRRFTYEGSRHGAINKAIERLVNKRIPSEKFPNYVEVHNLIRKVNEEKHLLLDSNEVENAAKEAFEDVGIELKKRRQRDEERDFGSYLTDDLRLETDPAEHDEELKKKLSCSVAEGEKKIKELIDKYASEQQQQRSDEAMEDEGSDCEEAGAEAENDGDGSGFEEPPNMDAEAQNNNADAQHHANESPNDNDEDLEEPPADLGEFVEENSNEIADLPDTDPATPETDEREDEETAATKAPVDVIDIDSSSDASTEPGSAAADLKSSVSQFKLNSETPIIIADVIEIAVDQRASDDSSPDLPSLSQLIR